MKTLNKTILILVMAFAATVSSCKKDDDGGGGGSAGEGTVTAIVNGNSFTSMDIASTASESTSGSNTTITIQGSDASGKGIFLIINGYDDTGSYEISDSNVFITANYVEANAGNPQNSQSWNAPYQASGVVGEINISEKSTTTIKGTFSFKAKNVNGDQSIKDITEGSFNVNFQ
ncbi:hypothetical protein ATE92_0546 [Ulvibacter sp. MAR_2010_11]|uniref:DUF6252 family protein n=1 Tax=Ulvibacter sp. MAR_2010_11 TaxID=1250229 RepID=UPI000C2CAD43|nr:DUF6252 family protein [Ulvibacter sp. MAR_2010_11]PKA82417.1 hypothetical protein ATE92_0546 [Ulvibacter sp. MAR_2010_11]